MKFPFLVRLFLSPLIFVFFLFIFIYLSFKGTYLFVKNGGELLVYEKDDLKTIQGIYNSLKEKNNV